MGRRKKQDYPDFIKDEELDLYDDLNDEIDNLPVEQQQVNIDELPEDIKAEINTGSDAGKSFEQLIIENEKFVYSVVNKEFKNTPWDIKPDLYSAGKQGLVYAATKFDSKNYKNKFISYAVNWIRYYINEELRNMYPVKLNQNYVYKRNKIKKFITKYEEEFNRQPTYEEISKELGMSVKVVGNILGINNGENFSFVSFQSVNKDAGDDPGSENYVENKLVNEYLEETESDQGITKFEFKDLLLALKKRITEKDYNMFVDKYINNLSYSDIAKKYDLNFPSSAKYVIERVENLCKQLLS
jgi:RNA polymerase primary sigma factor